MIQRLKKTLKYNKMQKLAALIVSASLWVYVMSSQDPPMKGSYNVQVRLNEFSQDYKVVFDQKNVEVELTGARSNFAEYRASDIHAFLNASNLSEGEYDLPVEITFPKGFDLSEVEPEKIHVKIDPIIEKQIPAEVIVTGSPAPNNVVKAVQKSQENITIIGSKSDISKVSRVLGYIGLTSNKDDFEIRVPLSAIDVDGREVKGVRIIPSAVMVLVDIESGLSKKVVPVTAAISPPAGREIEEIVVSPSFVEISGREEILNNIDSVQTTKAIINAGNENFDGNLKIVLPAGIDARTNEVHVTATLKEK